MPWILALVATLCLGSPYEVGNPEFREGAMVFVSELLEMDEPGDQSAAVVLLALIQESVARYAFWRAHDIAYHNAPHALVTGSVSEWHMCRAVRELISLVCLDPDTKKREKFAVIVLFEMCPAPRAAR